MSWHRLEGGLLFDQQKLDAVGWSAHPTATRHRGNPHSRLSLVRRHSRKYHRRTEFDFPRSPSASHGTPVHQLHDDLVGEAEGTAHYGLQLPVATRNAKLHRLANGEVLFNLPLLDPYILVMVYAHFAMLRFHLAVCFHDGNARPRNSCPAFSRNLGGADGVDLLLERVSIGFKTSFSALLGPGYCGVDARFEVDGSHDQ